MIVARLKELEADVRALYVKCDLLKDEINLSENMNIKLKAENEKLLKKCKAKEGEIRYAEDELHKVMRENTRLKERVDKLNKRRVELADKLEDCQSGE